MKKIVVGNWKMDPLGLKESQKILKGVLKGVSRIGNVDVIVCPPFLYTVPLVIKTRSKKFFFGAQDVAPFESGSHTGEISASQLADAGVSYVVIGHSERRALGETSDVVSQKVEQALASGMTAVLCIGEGERDEVNGKHLEFIKKELFESLKRTDKEELGHIVIAYEPIWAIGKEEAMKPQQIHEMSIFIKRVLIERYGADAIEKVRIIYGGSVTPDNVEEIVAQGHVDGVLPGRASRDPEQFSEIVKKVSEL